VGLEDRKQWIEDRLQVLSASFSLAVGGFAILDNHLHVLCRLDPAVAESWDAEEVLRRWIAVYPPRALAGDDPQAVQAWIGQAARDTGRVEQLRQRLADLGWFMKALKEPLARMANKADGCRGAFWAARYKSIAILDSEALLATCAYIDLNPVAAGIAATPETSRHTSIRQRVDHARRKGKLGALQAARRGSVSGSRAAGNLEQDHWLVPLEDRRRTRSFPPSGSTSQGPREGMLESFSLGSYLLLVDYTGRLFRQGKARISGAVQEIFQRLGTASETWSERIRQMLRSRDLRGHFFATQPSALAAVSQRRSKRLPNLTPQPPASG
jgi:hypothetical protein